MHSHGHNDIFRTSISEENLQLWAAFRHVLFFRRDVLISKFPCNSAVSMTSHTTMHKSKNTYTRQGEVF